MNIIKYHNFLGMLLAPKCVPLQSKSSSYTPGWKYTLFRSKKEQYEVCSPKFYLKYICICAKTTLIAPEM